MLLQVVLVFGYVDAVPQRPRPLRRLREQLLERRQLGVPLGNSYLRAGGSSSLRARGALPGGSARAATAVRAAVPVAAGRLVELALRARERAPGRHHGGQDGAGRRVVHVLQVVVVHAPLALELRHVLRARQVVREVVAREVRAQLPLAEHRGRVPVEPVAVDELVRACLPPPHHADLGRVPPPSLLLRLLALEPAVAPP